jgi:CTP:molybdopterin cytidylyltransferase MocA
MGAFKPLLPLKGDTLIGTQIAAFRSAGIGPIVVVTGREAERLGQALLPLEIRLIHNPGYDHLPMMSSARLGLAEMLHKADRVLFTPADIPLFTGETIRRLLESPASVVIPTHLGTPGHPVCFDDRILPELLAYPEGGSLRDAIAACSGPVEYLEVPDSGILLDADTPADYARIRLLAGD